MYRGARATASGGWEEQEQRQQLTQLEKGHANQAEVLRRLESLSKAVEQSITRDELDEKLATLSETTATLRVLSEATLFSQPAAQDPPPPGSASGLGAGAIMSDVI